MKDQGDFFEYVECRTKSSPKITESCSTISISSNESSSSKQSINKLGKNRKKPRPREKVSSDYDDKKKYTLSVSSRGRVRKTIASTNEYFD